MKLWNATVSYRLKTKSYWSRPAVFTLHASSVRQAASKALVIGRAPRGSRIAEYSVKLENLGTSTAVTLAKESEK